MTSAAVARYRGALRYRDFRLLLSAFLVDQIGSWAYNVVLIVYVFDRTGSPTWVAATTAASWVPRMLFATFAGVVADRYERVRLLRISAGIALVLMAALAVVMFGDGPVLLVLALAAATATVGTVYLPTSGALVAEVVDEQDLAAANALLGVVENLVVVVGPAGGGVLLVLGRPAWGVVANCASFALTWLLLAAVRVRSRGSTAEDDIGLLRQLGAGIGALQRDATASTLVGFCALGTAVYGSSTVLYVPMSERFGTGSNGYSYLLAGAALGGVLGAVAVGRVDAPRLAPAILGGMLLLALPFAVTALTHSAVLGWALQVVSGSGMVVVDVLTLTALQRGLPNAVLSRVLGILETAALGAALVAGFLVAALLHAVGLTAALVVVGGGFAALALLGLPALTRADRRAAEAARVLVARARILDGLALFAATAQPMLERLASGVEERTAPAGTVVVREGDRADALWILVGGGVAVTSRGTGDRPVPIRRLVAPAYFGEIGLLRNLPRTATVTAVEPCTLWRISAGAFFDGMRGAQLSGALLSRTSAWLAITHPHLTRAETDGVLPPG